MNLIWTTMIPMIGKEYLGDTVDTKDELDEKDHQVHQDHWDLRAQLLLFSSKGMGDLPSLNLSTTTVGVENSLQYMGDSTTKLLEAQRHANQTMVAHMNALTAAQETQSVALAQLVENTHQREFDKMFNAIPMYDGEDPDKFKPWLEQLQNACGVGKHDI